MISAKVYHQVQPEVQEPWWKISLLLNIGPRTVSAVLEWYERTAAYLHACNLHLDYQYKRRTEILSRAKQKFKKRMWSKGKITLWEFLLMLILSYCLLIFKFIIWFVIMCHNSVQPSSHALSLETLGLEFVYLWGTPLTDLCPLATCDISQTDRSTCRCSLLGNVVLSS